MCTCIMKLMLRHVRVGGGVGGVMLTFMCTCIMKLILRHVRVGDGVGGVMLTFTCTCIMKLMVRHVSWCIDRKWQSLKKWIRKELRNKQKFTRDVNEFIRDYVFAFVCRTNWGKANTLKNLADLASKCWVQKKRVRNACATIWWWYPIELLINGLRVAQIPSKRPNPFFQTHQEYCKGWEFHGCLGLQTSKISGTVVPLWPCIFVFLWLFLWWCGRIFVVVFLRLWLCFCGGVAVSLRFQWWCFCGEKRWRRVLKKTVVKKCWRRVLCCREVLEKSVVEKRCREVLYRSVVEKFQKCWRRFWRRGL